MIIKILDYFIKQLTWIVRQVNKDGVNSEVYNYMYNEQYKAYIADARNKKYPVITNDVNYAKNWNGVWNRNIILWMINFGKLPEYHYHWQNVISLSGGNWSGVTSTLGQASVQQNLLKKYDDLSMEDIK